MFCLRKVISGDNNSVIAGNNKNNVEESCSHCQSNLLKKASDAVHVVFDLGGDDLGVVLRLFE